jgi:aspartate/methionine/tyrosine aminotransferase
VAEPAVVAVALRLNDFISVLYPSPSAAVGAYALARLPALRERAAQARRAGLAVVDGWLAAGPAAGWQRSEAGIIGLLALSGVRDTTRFCRELAQRWDTSLVPGEFFDAPGHVRIGFGIEPSLLAEGLARLGRALAEWQE